MPRSLVEGARQRPFARLAEHLIALRRTARLTQRALAQAANISRGAVQRAESGTAAPTAAVLDAYVRACGGGPAETARARLLRKCGRTAQRDRLRTLNAPAPPLIHTEDDLGAALAAAYERAGAPCLSDARLTPGRTPLPRTTAWRIINRKGLPSTTQLVTFLTACGIRPAEHRPYINAYQRITANRRARPTPPAARPTVIRHRIPLSQGGTATPTNYATKISQPFQNLLTVLSREDVDTVLSAGIAHLLEERGRRNGTPATAPEWLHLSRFIGHDIDTRPESPFDLMTCAAGDRGIDGRVRTSDGRTAVFETKSYYQHRPGQPPENLPTRATQPPPPRPTPPAHAA
ncbi:helix-turn-helix transcriptional regulator [Streptomyces longisporus]|uniref:HTH cro/C1-type domain-containing protein n=1 Tax=Streptomyces longisporus TaxID=1948 RepID=A0ABN3NKM6_STRLO